MKLPIPLIIVVASFGLQWRGEARSYTPLSQAAEPASAGRLAYVEVNSAARPMLPGMRPVGLELLEDALRRKQPLTIGDSKSKAHASIIRNSLRSPAKRSHMIGMLAEALYLERNPSWGYVRSPTASQHDLYARLAGRKVPLTAQVKTHASGDATTYARDMVKDHRSTRFLVPDDHVEALKLHWRSQFEKYRSLGNATEANAACRQLARVRGLGVSYQAMDATLTKAAHHALRERSATYVSMGAGLAMAFGPDALHWLRHGSLDPGATARWVRSGTLLSAGGLASASLKHIAKGAWRGTWRGNVVVGAALVVAEGYFTVQDFGGVREAFSNPNFYCRMSGAIGGTSLALAVGAPVAIWATQGSVALAGPYAPLVGAGAGLLAGGTAYVVGSFGSESAVRWVFETLAPESLHQAELNAVAKTTQEIKDRISNLQREAL